MPSILRSRVALVLMLGAFIIPIGMSSLRGLTHILTCEEASATPFTLQILETGDVVITTSSKMERGEETTLCGGLILDMAARLGEPDEVSMDLSITNETPYDWRGTIELRIGDTPVPLDIGEVPAGSTEVDSVDLTLDAGVHDLSGSLLIGP